MVGFKQYAYNWAVPWQATVLTSLPLGKSVLFLPGHQAKYRSLHQIQDCLLAESQWGPASTNVQLI